jgi:hypothetical protein
MQKPVAVLYMNNEKSEEIIGKTIAFTTVSKVEIPRNKLT